MAIDRIITRTNMDFTETWYYGGKRKGWCSERSDAKIYKGYARAHKARKALRNSKVEELPDEFTYHIWKVNIPIPNI